MGLSLIWQSHIFIFSPLQFTIMTNLGKFINNFKTLRNIDEEGLTDTQFFYIKKDFSEAVIDNCLLLHRKDEFDYVIPFAYKSKPTYIKLLGFYDKNYKPIKIILLPAFTTEKFVLVDITQYQSWSSYIPMKLVINNQKKEKIEVKVEDVYREKGVVINISESAQKAIEEHNLKSNNIKQ